MSHKTSLLWEFSNIIQENPGRNNIYFPAGGPVPVSRICFTRCMNFHKFSQWPCSDNRFPFFVENAAICPHISPGAICAKDRIIKNSDFYIEI